ncbi:MAG TPA: hypothetical protein VIA09_00310 [Nitrososphaeraceae archaeon]
MKKRTTKLLALPLYMQMLYQNKKQAAEKSYLNQESLRNKSSNR